MLVILSFIHLLFKLDLRTYNPVLLIPLILSWKYRIRNGRYNSPTANIRAEPKSSTKQIKDPGIVGVIFLLVNAHAPIFAEISLCAT